MMRQELDLNILKELQQVDGVDITIGIFNESMKEYVEKLQRVARGTYELDNYDRQVLKLAVDQCQISVGLL